MTSPHVHPKVCVIGLGYIGLPLASLAATQGLTVLGVDINPEVVRTLQSGDIHIAEPDLHALAAAATQSGKLRVAGHPEPSDFFVICVPTPFRENHHSDLSFVENAARSIVPHLRPGCTVILESTVPTGTTRQRLAPILEQSGLQLGTTIFAAYCPERVLPGRILRELVDNDRIIGGVDGASTQKAKSFYASFVQGELHETDSDTAEMVKLVENSYRDVNIAFANELANICATSGLNVWDVIRLANRHPRVDILSPGPGVGGHCIAVDPWFIVEKAGERAKLIRAAREVNDARPAEIVRQVLEAVGEKRPTKVACFGLTYKANVDDIRESPAMEVVKGLIQSGIEVAAHDPFVERAPGITLYSLEDALRNADALVLLVDHKEYTQLDWNKAASLMARPIFIDTRGVLAAGLLKPTAQATPV